MKHILLLLPFLLFACSTNKYVREKRVVERTTSSAVSLEPMDKGMEGLKYPAANFQGPYDISPPGFDRVAAEVYLPLQYESKSEWPLIVLLHGYGANGFQQDEYLSMHNRVSGKGFILLVPEGTKDANGKQFWNATDACCDFGNSRVNDVDYLSKLIAETKAKYHVNSKKIYLFGHSNGGFMANRLACEIGDELAGIASLAGGSFKRVTDCRMPRKMFFLQIHAENDPTVSYEDDPRYAGAVESVNQWVTRNDCPSAPQRSVYESDYVTLIPGGDTKKKFWEKCKNGTQVSFWTIKAHTAPNHLPHIPFFRLNFADDVIDSLFQFSK